MSKAKNAGTTKSLRKNDRTMAPQKKAGAKAKSDKPLIVLCVQYHMAQAAFDAAFKGDPDGSNVHAERANEHLMAKMSTLLAKIAATPAVGMSGLSAKARAVPVALSDYAIFGNSSAEAMDFLSSFAADVKRITDEAIENERRAIADAAKGGAK